MRPGIVIQHHLLPGRGSGLVRGDIAGIIGFASRARWPEGAVSGDFTELVLRREDELWNHPDRDLFDAAARRAVRGFFENGGDTAHLFGVCIRDEDDLKAPESVLGVLAPLFDRLRAEDDIGLLAVPAAAYMRCTLHRDGSVHCDADALYDELLGHCRQMSNRFLVLDAPRGLHGEPLSRWVEAFRSRGHENRSFGALYYPWLVQGDDLFPPSGVVLGTFARVELDRPPFGIAQPPANVALRGVTHPEIELDWSEAGDLAAQHVNPIVVHAGTGMVAFGARTLSRDPAWMHINARRIVNMVGEQLRRDNQWAVFEANNPNLWDVLRRDVRHRLSQFWERGLLIGGPAGEDYSVVCDAGLNPPASRDAGQVNVEVRLRPVGTTEQIIIDLRIGGDTQAGGV